MFVIHGQAARLFTALDGPALFFLEGLSVDGDQLRLVFDIYVDAAFSISGGKFGLAAERQAARHGAGCRVDRSCVVAAAVEGEDALGDRIVCDGVRAFARFGLTDFVKILEIEDSDAVGAAAADEASAEFGGECNPMHTRSVRNVAHDLA